MYKDDRCCHSEVWLMLFWMVHCVWGFVNRFNLPELARLCSCEEKSQNDRSNVIRNFIENNFCIFYVEKKIIRNCHKNGKMKLYSVPFQRKKVVYYGHVKFLNRKSYHFQILFLCLWMKKFFWIGFKFYNYLSIQW